jgi:negative regulator of flagellin synthesis FlgM
MAININNLNNNAQVTAKHAEQQRNQQVQQNSSQQAQNAQQAASAPRQDSVSLSSSQSLNQATKKAQDSSGIDQSKVDKIKKALSEGSYKVDAEKLATNLISSEGKLFGL